MADNEKSFSGTQKFIGTIFVIAFLAALIRLFLASEGGATFATVLVAMAGAIIVVAVLPDLEEFGFGPNGVSAKLRRVEQRLDEQQKIINELVIYSLASQPYEMLRYIEDGAEYIYNHYSQNNDHQRWANTLLDSGFIEPRREKGITWLQFDENFNSKNVSAYAKTSPAGHFLVTLREKRG